MTRGEVRALAIILLALAALKFGFNPSPIGDLTRDDGAYYYQMARHVSQGDGLLTSVSLYHWGLQVLPSPAFSYPLWPIMLGIAGRFLDLGRAASLLPECLYFVSLALLFLLSRRIATMVEGLGPTGSIPIPRFETAVVVLLLLGLNPVFFVFTSLPYTEALGFSIAFLSLLLVPSPAQESVAVRGVLATFLACLAFLVRPQLFGVCVGVVAGLAAGAAAHRRFRDVLLLSLGVLGLVLGAWTIYLSRVLSHFTVAALFDHTAVHENQALLRHLWLVPHATFIDRVVDAGRGLMVAFDPLSRFSLVRSFGPAAYVVPAAVVVGAAAFLKKPRSRIDLSGPGIPPVISTVVAGCCCLGPVFLLHSFRWGEWFFQFRHGLPLILLLIFAVPYVMQQSRRMRVAVILLATGSLLAESAFLYQAMRAPYDSPTEAQQALGRWIHSQPRSPLFLSTAAAPLTAITGGRFHWMMCDDPGSQTRAYFRVVGVDYLVTTTADISCPFFVDFRNSLVEVRTFGTGPQRLTLWRSHE